MSRVYFEALDLEKVIEAQTGIDISSIRDRIQSNEHVDPEEYPKLANDMLVYHNTMEDIQLCMLGLNHIIGGCMAAPDRALDILSKVKPTNYMTSQFIDIIWHIKQIKECTKNMEATA